MGEYGKLCLDFLAIYLAFSVHFMCVDIHVYTCELLLVIHLTGPSSLGVVRV